VVRTRCRRERLNSEDATAVRWSSCALHGLKTVNEERKGRGTPTFHPKGKIWHGGVRYALKRLSTAFGLWEGFGMATTEKNAAAVVVGRLGRLRGGKARARRLSAKGVMGWHAILQRKEYPRCG